MKLRVVIVGCGEMGIGYHLPSLLKMKTNVDVVGFVRRIQDVVQQAPDIPVFTSFDNALQKLHPDLVVISTPHAVHASQIRSSLENGCHVLVEKPLALRLNEATELVEFAAKRNRMLVVGLQRRYEGFCSIVRRLKNEEHLGNVLFAHGFFANSSNLTGWRSDQHLAGEGILDDSAYHVLDTLLDSIGGRIKSLVGAKVLSENGRLPHSFSAIFEIDNGATLSASGSYLSPRESVQEEISLLSSKGAIFARRFCREWNTTPPEVFFKSRDGLLKEDFDLSTHLSGRTLPLETMIGVLLGSKPRTELVTEAKDTLETHRGIELIKALSH